MPIQYDIKLIYIDKRLQTWAAWYSRFLFGELGYSSIPFDQLLSGIGSSTTKQSQNLPINSTAESIETAMHTLREQNPMLVKILTIHYLYPGNLMEHARTAGVSRNYFTDQLKQAKRWLIGWFSARGEI